MLPSQNWSKLILSVEVLTAKLLKQGYRYGQEAISLHRDIIIIGRCVISVTSL